MIETNIYNLLENGDGIPKMHWYGVEDDYNILVIDLLGKSLEDLLVECGGKFTLKTTLQLSI